MQPRLNMPKNNFWLLALVGFIFANTVLWAAVFSNRNNDFVVSFYDVGQGDSALIQTPNGYNILVDGGANNKVSDYLNEDLPVGDREIDLMILTHPQSDHMFGLINVLK